MKFAASAWLWCLLFLPLIYLVFLLDEKRKRRKFEKFAEKKLWRLLVPEMDPKFRVRKLFVNLAALGFLILALARPQFGSHEEVTHLTGLDIMLALDISNSMEVEDVVPSRLKKAKHVIKSILEHLNGDRVGVAAFAASSQIYCPLTTDLDYVWSRVEILGPKAIVNQGTHISAGLDTALKALERGAEELKENDASASTASRIIILISDGENHDDQLESVAEAMKKAGVRLFVLGVGTQKGAPIPIKDENGNLQTYKKDRSGHPIVSGFHPETLQDVAKLAGGKYWGITAGEAEVSEILGNIGTLSRGDIGERRYVVYEERFQIPLAIAVILFFLELSLPARRLVACFIGVMAFLSTSSSQAQDSVTSLITKPAPLDSYLENKKGIDAYQSGNLKDAEKSFGAAQARDPSAPELEYNQGLVQLQQGESERAISSFGRAANLAAQKHDEALKGKSLYNLGKAFEKKGDLKSAARSYIEALKAAENTHDSKLEQETRKNLQLLVDETKKQQQKNQSSKDQKKQEQNQKQDQKQDQQQQNQKQDQDQKQDQKQNQNQNPDQKQDQKQGQKQEQRQDQKQNQQQKDQNQNQNSDQKQDQKQQQKQEQKQEQDPDGNQEQQEQRSGDSAQPFQSKKMSPEDADRVLSELKSRERQLQERLQNQNAKSQSNQKDW